MFPFHRRDWCSGKEFDSHPSEPGVTTTLPVPMADLDTGKTDITIINMGSTSTLRWVSIPSNSTRQVLTPGNTEKSLKLSGAVEWGWFVVSYYVTFTYYVELIFLLVKTLEGWITIKKEECSTIQMILTTTSDLC